jgi:tetratricopeptide (TPR) repeat protein
MGRTDDAIGECLKAINVDPEFGNPYNDIGSYLLRMGRFDDAIPWLQKAKQARRYQNPEFACGNLAKAYEFKGLIMPAIQEYKSALEISPDWTSAQTGLKRLKAMLN